MISQKASGITSFIVMDIQDKAKEMEARGEHIIHLEIGEPDFDAPQKVIEATINGLNNKDTHYTHSLGKITLRNAIADHYKKNLWRYRRSGTNHCHIGDLPCHGHGFCRDFRSGR